MDAQNVRLVSAAAAYAEEMREGILAVSDAVVGEVDVAVGEAVVAVDAAGFAVVCEAVVAARFWECLRKRYSGAFVEYLAKPSCRKRETLVKWAIGRQFSMSKNYKARGM